MDIDELVQWSQDVQREARRLARKNDAAMRVLRQEMERYRQFREGFRDDYKDLARTVKWHD